MIPQSPVLHGADVPFGGHSRHSLPCPPPLLLGSGLFAAAPATAVDVTNQAQNSLFGSSDVTDYLETDGVPQRTPIRTDEHPSIQGLPSGVSVERVEWITERRIALFIRSAAMPKELIQVQVLLARDWHSNPSAKYPEVWALDGLRALDTESGWTINTNIEQFYADKNVNVILPVGGESSFYSDWQKPDNGKHYKWGNLHDQGTSCGSAKRLPLQR